HDHLRNQGLSPFHGTNLESLGHYLVDARIASGMTQADLAEKIGVSQPMVYKYENSDYQGYGIDILQRVAEILGVQLELNLHKPSRELIYGPDKQEAVILFFLNEIPNSYLGK